MPGRKLRTASVCGLLVREIRAVYVCCFNVIEDVHRSGNDLISVHQERGIQRGWRGARQRGRGRRTTTRRPKSTTKVATPKKFSFSDDEYV